MNEQILVHAVEQLISNNIWKVILVFIICYILGGLIRQVANTLFEYISLKTDILGVGSYVYYNGKRAIIKTIHVRKIQINLEESNETVYIHIAEWRKLVLIVPNPNRKI